MSSSIRYVALLFACFVIVQLGCDRESSTETLKIRFEEMKTATNDFYANMREITDPASAEAMLPKLEESQKRLAIAAHELDLASRTSSRSSRNIKRDIADFKQLQKDMYKKEFHRLKSDTSIRPILDPFMQRINAF